MLQVEAHQESQFRGLPDINNQVFTFGNEDDQVKVTEDTSHWTVKAKKEGRTMSYINYINYINYI